MALVGDLIIFLLSGPLSWSHDFNTDYTSTDHLDFTGDSAVLPLKEHMEE